MKLNGRGDLAMDFELRRYIGTDVQLVKVTRAGLRQIRTPDGKLFSVPKRNLDPPQEWVRPDGFTGPCPECGSTTCPGYYKPDGNHFLAF